MQVVLYTISKGQDPRVVYRGPINGEPKVIVLNTSRAFLRSGDVVDTIGNVEYAVYHEQTVTTMVWYSSTGEFES